MRTKQYNNFKSGFTLIELLVAIALFVFIAAGVAGFAVYYFQSYSFSFEENQSIGLAQTGMTKMIREIREARSGEDGAWPLVQTEDNSLTFYSDVTNDGRTDRIRYFLEATDLKRGIIEPTAVPVTYPPENEIITVVTSYLANDTSPIFTYFNGNYPADLINNPLVNPSRILNTRYISIYLRINPTQNFSAQPFELTSGVQIRSLKDNL